MILIFKIKIMILILKSPVLGDFDYDFKINNSQEILILKLL